MAIDRIFIFFFVLVLLTGCEKPSIPDDHVRFLAPLAYARIDIDDIEYESDQLFGQNNQGNLALLFSDTIANFTIDSLLSISDTALADTFVWTFPAFPISPGAPIFTEQKTFEYDFNETQLTQVAFAEGKLMFTLNNNFSERLLVEFKILQSNLNNDTIKVEVLVPSADQGGFYQGEIDLTGAIIDLTGPMNNLYNNLILDYTISLDPQGQTITVNPGEQVDFSMQLKDVKPLYITGYFGNYQEQLSDTINLDFLEQFSVDVFQLQQLQASLQLINSIGVEASFVLNQLKNLESQMLFQAPFVGQNQNINAAYSINLPLGNITASNYLLSIDDQSSNIIDFIEQLPSKLFMQADFMLNPLGNHHNSSNFIHKDHGLELVLNTDIELAVDLENLRFKDTLELTQSFIDQFLKLKDPVLCVQTQNTMPITLELELFRIDAQQMVLDSIGQIQAVGSSNHSLSESLHKSALSSWQNNLSNDQRIVIHARVNEDQSGFVELLDSDYLDLQFSLQSAYDF